MSFLVFPGSKGQGGQEGGIRMPTAIQWKGHIPPGSEIATATSQMDMYPTLLAATGIKPPTDRILDGVNILNLLAKPESGEVPHRFLFHYCGVWLHAVRYTPEGDGECEIYIYIYTT